MEKNNLKNRFWHCILQHLKSEECRVFNSIIDPEEEKADSRVVFNLREVLQSCGASKVDFELVQVNGFSTIRVAYYEEQMGFKDEVFQRRQSSWVEHDNLWKEYDRLADKWIDEVVCVAEMKKDGGKSVYSMKWESIILYGKAFSFSGSVRAWDNKYYISPICDDESRIHCSEKDRFLLPVRSLYGFPVSEGMLHSRVWQLPDKRIQGYDDLLLSALFMKEGLTLVAIHISKDIYLPSEYEFLSEAEQERICPPYLLAEAIAFKDEDNGFDSTEHKYAVFSFRARYSGTKEQWELFENKTVSDLVIRCSFKPWEKGEKELSYYEPLWIAAFLGEKRFDLSGERIDYSAIAAEVRSTIYSREEHYDSSMSARDEYLELCDAFGDEPDDDILDCLGCY